MKRALAFLVMALVLVIAAEAQDATRAPFVRASDTPSITSIYTAEPTITATPAPTEVVGPVVNVYQAPITPAAPETPPPTVEAEPWFAKYVAYALAGLAVLFGFVKWVNARAVALLADKTKMTVGEQVYGHWVPAPVKAALLALAAEVEALGGNSRAILNELGDDKPIALK